MQIFSSILPAVVVDGTVLVARMGATVAAATGVTVLKIGFCREEYIVSFIGFIVEH